MTALYGRYRRWLARASWPAVTSIGVPVLVASYLTLLAFLAVLTP